MSSSANDQTDPLRWHHDDAVTTVVLDRPRRRNALDSATVRALLHLALAPPEATAVFLLSAEGPHFCAGLDLAEHVALRRGPDDFFRLCRLWHSAFDALQQGGVPVVAALQGAVLGGGLELAASAHVRIADETAFFALPEGERGIFTGGGATVRVARIVGTDRMTEMMLTGRVIDAQQALRIGLVHEVAKEGTALVRARELARKISRNAHATNRAIVTALPRIAGMSHSDGLYTEALVAAHVQATGEVHERLEQFLQRKTVQRP